MVQKTQKVKENMLALLLRRPVNVLDQTNDLITSTKISLNFQGRYVNSDKNGGIVLGSNDIEDATQWEY